MSMSMRSKILILAGVAALSLACSTEEPAPAATSTPTAAATAAATATPTASAAASVPTLRVAKAGNSDVLVDAKGLTLYTFKNDEAAPGKSVCNGGCATNWPPVIVTAAPTKDAAVTGEVGTVKRDDGSTQVTYRGRPLYRFAADTASGETKGAAVANWALVTPGGTTLGTSGAAPSASPAASGSSEYNY